MQKQQGGGEETGRSRTAGPHPQPKPSPQQGGQQQPKSDPNVEGLLRSVQQQEQEELQRMRKPSRERVHVGW